MHGADHTQGTLFSYADLEQRVPRNHPLRKLKIVVDAILETGKGYALSWKRRNLIDEAFGWAKTVGGLRKTRFIGLAKVKAQALLTFAAYSLTRMSRLFGWQPART
jgi:hypothetical protein